MLKKIIYFNTIYWNMVPITKNLLDIQKKKYIRKKLKKINKWNYLMKRQDIDTIFTGPRRNYKLDKDKDNFNTNILSKNIKRYRKRMNKLTNKQYHSIFIKFKKKHINSNNNMERIKAINFKNRYKYRKKY